MPQPALIFDLDMTLLDTSALQRARDEARWGFVRDNLHRAQPFDVATGLPPHKLPAILRNSGYPVAVVTSSPRQYAEALLKRFKVPYDVLVAYGDTKEHKPYPAPLQAALEQLKADAAHAYYVGDEQKDFEASYRAGICSIGAGWNPQVTNLWRTAPDILLYDPSLLKRPELLPRLGYVAEVRAAGLHPRIHQGSVLRCGSRRRVALGRYFPTAHGRSGSHQLTEQILEQKEENGPARRFGDALALYIAEVLKQPPAYVTCVPPKPSQDRNRFKAILKRMLTKVPAVKVCLTGMRRLSEDPDYKRVARADRSKLLKNTFKSTRTWKNKPVLLLDDVLNSGNTAKRCARELTANAASSVQVVCIGVNQEPFELNRCPCCQRVLKVYHRRDDGTPFWGCPAYKDGCRYTTSYP